jgi:hypothetical protein
MTIKNYLKKLSIQELKEARDIADDLIYNYKDGFLYECKVRSYGRNWTNHLNNEQAVQDLCHQYDGDDGIVDIYTTNPNLNVYNYGDTYYFPTLEEGKAWRDHQYIVNNIPIWKKKREEWDDRDNMPFAYRPTFEPTYTWEQIAIMEQTAADEAGSITQPIILEYTDPEDGI